MNSLSPDLETLSPCHFHLNEVQVFVFVISCSGLQLQVSLSFGMISNDPLIVMISFSLSNFREYDVLGSKEIHITLTTAWLVLIQYSFSRNFVLFELFLLN